jgi:hypothetical protein
VALSPEGLRPAAPDLAAGPDGSLHVGWLDQGRQADQKTADAGRDAGSRFGQRPVSPALDGRREDVDSGFGENGNDPLFYPANGMAGDKVTVVAA